jgi:hypothetical protein
VQVSRFSPTYLVQHPAPRVVAALVAGAAKSHRSE